MNNELGRAIAVSVCLLVPRLVEPAALRPFEIDPLIRPEYILGLLLHHPINADAGDAVYGWNRIFRGRRVASAIRTWHLIHVHDYDQSTIAHLDSVPALDVGRALTLAREFQPSLPDPVSLINNS
ncbi:hypothetical protein M8C13_07010 [Crossiella sp. SN42]|uniref:hypothetical protein n=1 Tax=Crossiella sp. SN42 TaxID=2944808 RepID=UPI00207D354B|nr:hypothetical protein [Crossiella sp. SN42]MCO1575506.1 hypothetical protein [Crossiella sp. SN42]